MGNQDSRDTGSMLSPTQSGSSSWEPSPMLPLGRGRYHCTASRFSSGRAQATWIRKPLTTTSLAETHGTGSQGGSATTQRPRCLPSQLGRQAEPRSRLQSHKALIRRLYNKCCRDPLEKEAHRSWWETMVTLCRAALQKGKSWPQTHDRAIQEVADSWEHPDWLAVLENLRYIRNHPEGPSERYSRPYKLQ